MQARLSEPISLPTTVADTVKALKEARKKVTEIRKNAIQERDTFLSALSVTSDHKAAIKRIQHAEELKNSYKKIRHILKPTMFSLVTQVEIPADNQPPKLSKQWSRITDPTEVTNIIFNRNVKHFQGAHGTPFTTPPLSDQFDWSATSSSHKDTLDGHPPQSDSPLVADMLKQLKRKLPEFSATVSLEDISRRFRKWNEQTSTSPSRRHLGHYKSLLSPISPSDDSESDDATSILDVHLSLINFCARTGYSLHRWQKIVTTTIPKEANNFKLHRLRVIHLYEANLTCLFSIWSRRMILAAEKAKSLHPGSFGARPGRTSTDPPFIQLLQIEYSHLS